MQGVLLPAATVLAQEKLLIAEANTTRTPLVGQTLREARLTELGVSVVGVWDRGPRLCTEQGL